MYILMIYIDLTFDTANCSLEPILKEASSLSMAPNKFPVESECMKAVLRNARATLLGMPLLKTDAKILTLLLGTGT